ncbi:MAG: hypothetical protein AABX88_01880 [Nanoarchaeota archaeon]
MAEVIGTFGEVFISYYKDFISFFPVPIGNFIDFILLVLLVFFYVLFIWKVHEFISKKNILELNLHKYNTSENSASTKFLAVGFYFLEYIIILPFLIFFWFVVFTLLLMLLSSGQEVSQILVISAVVVAVIRMTAYYNETLSKEIAKIFPFTLLAVFALELSTFIQSEYIQTIIMRLTQIPSFFSQVFSYLIFILLLEMTLRFFEFIFSFFDIDEFEEEEKENKKR